MTNGILGNTNSRADNWSVTTDPTRAFAHAEALERDGKFAEAEAIYRGLLRSLPSHPAILTNLALTLKAKGELAESESLLRQAITVAPRDPNFRNNLGNVLRAQDKLIEAQASYRDALSIWEEFPEAHYNLGITLDDFGRADEALVALRRAVALRPKYFQAQTRIGAIGYRNKRFEAALIELDNALVVNPHYFDANYYRGLVLAALGRHDEALDALNHALELRPESIEPLIGSANTLRDAARHNESLLTFWRLLEKRPGRIATHYELNSYAWSLGRKDLFLKSFAYAREHQGDIPDLLLNEAAFRIRAGESPVAEHLLRRAREISPERADISGLLGRALAQQKKFADSFEYFQAAITIDPATMMYRQELGFALLNDQQPKESLRVLEDARKREPLDQMTLAARALGFREVADSRYGELIDFDAHVRSYDIRLPPGFHDAKTFNELLAEQLKKLHTESSEPIDQSLRQGTQSTGDLFGADESAIQHVRDSISEAVADYISNMPNEPNHPLFGRKLPQFTYSGSWSCLLRPSGYHANHVHPRGWISSAYYVQLPSTIDEENNHEGWLKFGESNLALGKNDRPEHQICPVVGRLVLFPSYYWHGTVPFAGNDTRLAIAFDVVPGIVAHSGDYRPY